MAEGVRPPDDLRAADLAAAEGAALAWGGAVRLRPVSARENVVFEAELPQGRAALRLHRRGYQSPAAIRSELWWTAALADRGLPVPRPIPRPRGGLLARAPDGRHASAVAWLPGRAVGAGGEPLPGSPAEQRALHVEIGALLARLHLATDRLDLPRWFVRPRWGIAALAGRRPRWGRFWENPAARPSERRTLGRARAALARALAALPAAPGATGLIHADVLRENLLATPAGLALIDFDDAGFGFRLYDLGTALSQSVGEADLPERAAALAEGYAAHRPLAAAERAALPAFLLARCLASAGWTIGRLAPDDPRQRRYLERALVVAEAVLAGRLRFA